MPTNGIKHHFVFPSFGGHRMSIYDEDWHPQAGTRPGETSPPSANRYNQGAAYLPATLALERSEGTPGASGARRQELPAQPQVIIIPHQGESKQAIQEHTSPIQRAVATVIASAFWGLITIPLGLLLIWLTDADPGAIVVVILAIVLATGYMFLRFNQQAHDHSPAGVALHDRDLTHTERMYELERRYDQSDRMMDYLIADYRLPIEDCSPETSGQTKKLPGVAAQSSILNHKSSIQRGPGHGGQTNQA
jgi:hypothetical protein